MSESLIRGLEALTSDCDAKLTEAKEGISTAIVVLEHYAKGEVDFTAFQGVITNLHSILQTLYEISDR